MGGRKEQRKGERRLTGHGRPGPWSIQHEFWTQQQVLYQGISFNCSMFPKDIIFLVVSNSLLSYLFLLFFGTLHSDAYIFPFLLCFLLLFFSQLFVRPPQTAILLLFPLPEETNPKKLLLRPMSKSVLHALFEDFCGFKSYFKDFNQNMYNIMYEMSCQSRFDARYWTLGAGALGRPRGMVWGGRREEGSGWGTHVYLWQIHFDIWQN